MLNKVWFWLAFIGLMTALSIDLYEMFAVEKQFSSTTFNTLTEVVVADETESAFLLNTTKKGRIEEAFSFVIPSGATLPEIKAAIEKDVAPVAVSVKEFTPESLETDQYFQNIINSLKGEMKGDESGKYMLTFSIAPSFEEEYGELRSIAFQKPVDVLALEKRNVIFNEPYDNFGHLKKISDGLVKYAELGVELALGLIGIMALWLGIMQIAEKAGLIQLLAKIMAPVMRLLFPEIPEDHPAIGNMLLNISANVIGLGNAATPLGLKAMEELQELNGHRDTASNAMCTFLVINTSGFVIIPTTIIGIRVAGGSMDPFAILLPIMAASGTATIVGITAVKVLQSFFPYDEKTAKSVKKDDEKKEGE